MSGITAATTRGKHQAQRAWAWEWITAYLEEPERVARELGKDAERREDTQEHQSFELDIKHQEGNERKQRQWTCPRNLLMSGPPGNKKTSQPQAPPSVLPSFTKDETFPCRGTTHPQGIKPQHAQYGHHAAKMLNSCHGQNHLVVLTPFLGINS